MSSKKTNLFQLLTGLRFFGKGAKVQRTIHKLPNTSFVITKVHLSPKSQVHGKVWGRLIWRGKAKEKNELMGSPLKKEWQLISLPDYSKFAGGDDDVDAIVAENSISTTTQEASAS